MPDVDLVVIGAGLSGCALISRLRQLGWGRSIALVEAGRGPGGRTATRRRRDDNDWRLDHGAPGIDLPQPLSKGLNELLQPLQQNGALIQDRSLQVILDEKGATSSASEDTASREARWRGWPCMSSICAALLDQAGTANLQVHWQQRVRFLSRSNGSWFATDDSRTFVISSSRLVLSGSLPAHPRSLAMLDWQDVPLRVAVTQGTDPSLDLALQRLALSESDVRWNLMLEIAVDASELPRQIRLTPEAQKRWGVERIVLQTQLAGRTGMVVHGSHDGSAITPSSQPQLMEGNRRRLTGALDELLEPWPELRSACRRAKDLGVMRWGASQPLNNPVEQQHQWCDISRVGFCGDYVEGPGFGAAKGALESAVALADRLVHT